MAVCLRGFRSSVYSRYIISSCNRIISFIRLRGNRYGIKIPECHLVCRQIACGRWGSAVSPKHGPQISIRFCPYSYQRGNTATKSLPISPELDSCTALCFHLPNHSAVLEPEHISSRMRYSGTNHSCHLYWIPNTHHHDECETHRYQYLLRYIILVIPYLHWLGHQSTSWWEAPQPPYQKQWPPPLNVSNFSYRIKGPWLLPEGLTDLTRELPTASNGPSQRKGLSAVRCEICSITICYSSTETVWRGNGTNVLRYFPTQALNFAFKDSFKQTFGFKKSENFSLWVLGRQGILLHFWMVWTSCQETWPVGQPLEHRLPFSCIPLISRSITPWNVNRHLTPQQYSARTRLSADGRSAAKGGQRQFSGLIDVYRQTLRSDGVVGLYRGFVPSVVGICVYRGL